MYATSTCMCVKGVVRGVYVLERHKHMYVHVHTCIMYYVIDREVRYMCMCVCV